MRFAQYAQYGAASDALFFRGNNLTERWSFDDASSLVHGRHPDDDARDADVLNIMVMQCERN